MNLKNAVFTFNAPIESVDALQELANRFPTFYHRIKRNADGSPQRWRVSGAMKLWRRDGNRMRLPVKHGLYNSDAITSLEQFNANLSTGYEVTVSHYEVTVSQ